MSSWKEVCRTWSAHFGLQISTVFALVFCLTVISSFLVLSKNIEGLFSNWSENLEVSVYLKDNLNPTDLEKLKQSLKDIPAVEDVAYVSKEDYKRDFLKQAANVLPDLSKIDQMENPFSNSYNVHLAAASNLQEIPIILEKIAAQIAKLANVEDVTYGKLWVKEYAQFVIAVNSASGFIITALLLATLFVVGNVIHQAIARRREEIAILELVGATQKMIRTPFVLNAVLLSAASSSLSVILSYIAFKWASRLFQAHIQLLSREGIHFLSAFQIFSFVALSILLCGFAAYVYVSRTNNGRAAST